MNNLRAREILRPRSPFDKGHRAEKLEYTELAWGGFDGEVSGETRTRDSRTWGLGEAPVSNWIRKTPDG